MKVKALAVLIAKALFISVFKLSINDAVFGLGN